ncbi:MAG TPA: tetratricopeptide repeat protein, partial [Rhizomicrobium sp.]|nr:tetratricopeptide repeat protein [Rhizomicrobium sp.]
MSQPIVPNPAQLVARAMAQADQARQAGQMAEAERICRSVLQMQPNAVPALNYLSLLLNMRGELTEAETLIRKAIALLPREATL